MKLNKLPKEFIHAATVIREIQANGYEAYFVGGCVRDIFLDKPIHDVDIATSAYPEEVKQIFKRTVDVGIEHGTVLVLVDDEQYEITTFRTESTYQDYRRPDQVTFVRSLEEDLKRRDFTINALAMNADAEIIDLFDGMDDIHNRIIRAVGNPEERFYEDALRMMRGLRFASQLDFSIENKTLEAIEKFHSLLEKISVERITVEFIKLLLGMNRKSGLIPFVETKCYQYCPGLKKYGESILNFSDLLEKQINSESQAWTLFIHSLNLENSEIRSFLKEWKLSNHRMQKIQQLHYGLNQRLLDTWNSLDLYQLGLEKALLVEELLPYFGQINSSEETKTQFEALPIYERSQLAVTGNDLLEYFDKKPGKWVGELIEYIERSVLYRQVENNKKTLLVFAEETFF
ncbi:CCA tRNA nucleotidyltransferase [Enterococcus rivorum]|uniref:CCA-adding enzyme n=1 Tax=Enterococcus rivorum TaxID=762845 RepID=A0A1E5KXU5_9ENTE|nr:CCA tRNA nucleotidyltransferase [Enterococcus rivorum]MBP2099686.1 tRNA nucleotidyltransferase (CCA-adding enzyme) [Enterococcus rivorum]OEH82711.1 CCA tRNA nucleotidyltransferase [Enterococcus rivorum]